MYFKFLTLVAFHAFTAEKVSVKNYIHVIY